MGLYFATHHTSNRAIDIIQIVPVMAASENHIDKWVQSCWAAIAWDERTRLGPKVIHSLAEVMALTQNQKEA